MAIIHFLQSFASLTLTAFFKTITLAGNLGFLLTLISLIYWISRKSMMRRLIILLLPSLFVMLALKEIFREARPEGVALITEDGFSFPSGHALDATVVWGYLSLVVRKRLFTVFALLLIAAISLSRIYLGVHWPWDVAGGIVIGLVLLIVYRNIEENLSELLERLAPFTCIAIIAFFSVISFTMVPTMAVAAVMGLLVGMGGGIVFETRCVCFSESGAAWQLAGRVVVGVAGTALLWKGFGAMFPDTLPFAYLRCAIIGFWMTGTAPLVFNALQLSEKEARDLK